MPHDVVMFSYDSILSSLFRLFAARGTFSTSCGAYLLQVPCWQPFQGLVLDAIWIHAWLLMLPLPSAHCRMDTTRRMLVWHFDPVRLLLTQLSVITALRYAIRLAVQWLAIPLNASWSTLLAY